MKRTYMGTDDEHLVEALELLATLEATCAHFQERIHSLLGRVRLRSDLPRVPDATPYTDPARPQGSRGPSDVYVPDVR